MTTTAAVQPLATVQVGASRLTVLGTAHVSRASAETVKSLLRTGDYDAVAVELCPSRYHAIANPDALARMDLFQVLREGKAAMVTASLALGAYQQRLADQFGIEPGAEMRVAIACARSASLPVLLVDREIGVTLKRIYRNVPWWRRLHLLAGLMASVISHAEVSEEEIERLKEGDILETTFAQFAERAQDLYQPLIHERDRYMAARLQEELAAGGYRHVLAVVGAGHLRGLEQQLLQSHAESPRQRIAALDQVPAPGRWLSRLPWVIVALVFIGFAIGFSRSPELGWLLVRDWVIINGSLSAAGAILATAHPLTVLTAFVAAPITSLNPMVGAGMVSAGAEVFLRRPSVGDFARLRQDTSGFAGWWRNRVSRALLVFVLSTLGSGLGTYLAGFRILERLTAG